MLPVYFIRDVHYGGDVSNGYSGQAWLREHAPGKYVLDFLPMSGKPALYNSVCFTDPDDAAAAVISASKQDLYGLDAERELTTKKPRPELQVVKIPCSVYPMQCDVAGTFPSTSSAFIHADKGPFTYYALRETTLESYFYRCNLRGVLLQPLDKATLFTTHKKAANQLSRLLKWNSEVRVSSDELELVRAKDLRWRVEKRHGFLVEKANSRMTKLFGQGDWRQTPFMVVPHLESF